MTGNPDVIIVGAGPAGLASAVTMGAAGLDVIVLEQADSVGSVWRRHYDRLHLHTDRGRSGLPGMAMPRTFPTYPSRLQVIEYLESYAAHFNIRHAFGTKVSRIRHDDMQWRVDAGSISIAAPVVVIATGIADAPHRPFWPGLEAYQGSVVHSSEYRNPKPYAGKRVLVVGFGNSGGEIALDLANAGVDVGRRFAAQFRFCRVSFWGFRFWHGLSCTSACRRGWSTWSTLRYCGSRLVESKSWDCAALPRGRGKWSRRTDVCR
jgi:cation diffusion facilitator CzcD-associated flavoprotein CzcO